MSKRKTVLTTTPIWLQNMADTCSTVADGSDLTTQTSPEEDKEDERSMLSVDAAWF